MRCPYCHCEAGSVKVWLTDHLPTRHPVGLKQTILSTVGTTVGSIVLTRLINTAFPENTGTKVRPRRRTSRA